MHPSASGIMGGKHVHLCTRGKDAGDGAVQCWSLVGISLLVFVHLGCFGGGAIYINGCSNSTVTALAHAHFSLAQGSISAYLLVWKAGVGGQHPAGEPRSGAGPIRCYLRLPPVWTTSPLSSLLSALGVDLFFC